MLLHLGYLTEHGTYKLALIWEQVLVAFKMAESKELFHTA
jgi:hypothetical protein